MLLKASLLSLFQSHYILIRSIAGCRDKTEAIMEGVHSRVFLVICLALLGTKGALATKHDVVWDPSTDLSSWASKQTFKVGDQLVFKYASGLHSVVEVSSEKEYKNCDIGSPMDSKSGGNDVIKLTKPGTRYFTCGTSGHCGEGMKLKIKTVAASSSSDQDSTSPSSSTSSTTASAAPSHVHYSVASFVLFFASITIIGLINVV